MVATDNRSACEFQSGLASSRRAMKTAERENCWTASNRADGAGGQNTPSLIASGWKQEKLQHRGKCFLLTSPSIERICHPGRSRRLDAQVPRNGRALSDARFKKAVERGKVLGAFDNAVRTKPLARYWWHRSCVGLSRDTRRCSS